MNQLQQLQQFSTIVADTGDIASIQRLQPQDATTNPSLILKAATQDEYAHIIAKGLEDSKHLPTQAQRLQGAIEAVSVGFGLEILKVVPGLVSTEVDARASFDMRATLEQARRLIKRYQEAGIDRERVLVKIASTWEGIQAARLLEQEGIHCNLTLLFNFAQAQACAEGGVTLISPFVGRILDWYKKSTGQDYSAETDPGVLSVKRIYDYYKACDYQTVVMAASFRNIGEINALAGCDKLTISPALLDALASNQEQLTRQLSPTEGQLSMRLSPLSEKEFRWQLNEDAMATEKLAEGIRAFAADLRTLEQKIETLCNTGQLRKMGT
ncbi:transaldolase [Agitococcus lubricus]|uniref:Transaldolase n=1 Tax=Agitococcus lubricus TaxID=1077255 RepID=A0A2T5IWT5_9GAMM|nr:transaldolase [Agitococcus lubricus]PTQ88394.1 transaldolase [Agitococcus lubricus]